MVTSLPIALLLTILIAVVVGLLVLPTLLIVVTPRRKGEERKEFEAAITKGEYEYEPHARSTETE
jgi:predicted RND superfamily exporter protein